MFIALAIILVLFIVAFILFLIVLRKMDFATFNKLIQKKVRRFARRNKLLAIDDLNILNYQREKVGINHVIFGKKYIYVITDFLLKGFIRGETNDNSWVYYDKIKKNTSYLSNLNKISEQNIQEFSGILGINTDPIVSICVVPNECDFSIEHLENEKKMVVHYSSLNRKIKEMENLNIGSLNEEQIYEQFNTIKERNK